MMIVLAQCWLRLGLHKRISPKGFVNLIYGQERQRQLTSYELDQNEMLRLHKEITSVEDNYVNSPKCNPSSMEYYPASIWRREASKRSYAEASGKKSAYGSSDMLEKLQVCIRENFKKAPKETMLIVTDEAEAMLQQIIQRCHEISFKEESFQQRLASVYTTVEILHNEEEASQSSASEDMDVVSDKKGGSLLGARNFSQVQGSMQHDPAAYELTPGKGVCGYAAICHAIMHSKEITHELHPGYYQGLHGMVHLHEHIKTVCKEQNLQQFPKTFKKFFSVMQLLQANPDDEDILERRPDLWLSLSDMSNTIYAFDLLARGWIFSGGKYKCYVDNSEGLPLAYNIMLYEEHFYLHSSNTADEIPELERCEISQSLDVLGGMISDEVTDNPITSRRLNMILQHRYLRSPQVCEIVPPMHPVSIHDIEHANCSRIVSFTPIPNRAALL